MARTRTYATQGPKLPLAPFEIDRRPVGPRDVAIEIDFCGICHSDIHQVRDEWGGATFPMVPGHEIVGRVTRVGADVKRFRVGDHVGVGCMVDSCRTCPPCKADMEQFCQKGAAYTYNSTEMDRKTPTFGGYSTDVVVSEKFVLSVPATLDMAGAAPLLCAGITTYSPMRRWGVTKGKQVGVVGLGGLGHMGVK
ncbi:MAG: alcohol dehydrogenase catalytic domain-containing protein, partial [Deltaproteobacteria bacterium]